MRLSIALERLAHDLQFSLRLLRKTPGFAAVAILTLALGIGANTAIFSIFRAVLLRPLPYPNASRLVRIWQSEPIMGKGHMGTAPPEFAAYRDRARAFSSLAGYQPESFDLTGQGAPEHVSGYLATAALFATLRVRPLLGRTFTAQDERPGAPNVVVLSYDFWRRRFAQDPNVIASTAAASATTQFLRFNQRPYQIIGVMPKDFIFPATAATPGLPPAFWAPLKFSPAELNDWASSFDTQIVARLAGGVSLAQAQDDVARVAAAFQQEHPGIYSGNLRLAAAAEPWAPNFAPHTAVILRMLLAAVAFILVIACSNVANLLLARAAARRREMSVRKALGASAAALARQILAETAILAACGGAAGCALAYGLLRLMQAASIRQLDLQAAAIDLPVLLFTFALCAATCALCGFAPAWALRHSSVHDALQQSGSRSGESRAHRRISQSLIVAEVACCLVLLIGAALLARSFLRMLEVPLGFDPSRTLIARTTLNRQHYSPAKRHSLERQTVARLAALPGVSAVALTTHVPLADERQIGFLIDGAAPADFHWADNTLVTASYFRALGIPLLRGRTFSDADTPQAPLAAVINHTMAAQYWPHQDPIGKGFSWGGRHLTVIGIAGDVRVEALDKPIAPTIYNSAWQIESGASTSAVYLLRAAPDQDPRRLAASVQNAIWSLDRDVPILGFTTLAEVVSGSLAMRRASLYLVGSFAAIALLLSLIGIYGVLSYAVTGRVREMGVRLAIGAKPVEIAALITAQGLRLAAWGVLCGVSAAALAERSIATLVFGVRPLDPVAFGAGVLLVLVAAASASYLPARRAARLDPLAALRYD